VWFLHAKMWLHKSDFYTQSVIWYVSVWLWHAQVWFIHARVEVQHDACEFNTNQLKLTKNTKQIRIVFWLVAILQQRVWFSHHACDFNAHECFFRLMRVISTLMRVILTRYVLNYFFYNIHINPELQAHVCGRLKNVSNACWINTLRGIETIPYYVSIQHAYVQVQSACVVKIYISIW
jgi:hypothetical protein